MADKKPYPVDESTPAFRRIHFSNITAREIGAAAGFIYGLPEMPVEDITFDNISLHMAENAVPTRPAMMSDLEPMTRKGILAHNVKNVRFNHVVIDGHEGPAFQIDGGQGVTFTGCSSYRSSQGEPEVLLNQAGNRL